MGQRISYVSNWDKWGLDLAVLVNGIIGAENYLCGVFGATIGVLVTGINWGRDVAVLVTGIIVAQNYLFSYWDNWAKN